MTDFETFKSTMGNEIRRLRLTNELSPRELMRLLGFKNPWAYQGMEEEPNCSLKTLYKLYCLFPEFSLDKLFKSLSKKD